MKKKCLWIVLAVMFGSVGQAAMLKEITFDSSMLGHSVSGPFSVAFALGGGSEAGNNTAILSNFNFGSGFALGFPTLIGGASGDLASGVTLTDTDFDNFFIDGVTFGDTFSFTLTLTTNVDTGGISDDFIWSILDNLGNPLMTTSTSLLDPLLVVTIDSSDPSIATFGSDGGGVFFNAPTVTEASGVPEPGSMWLGALSLAGIGISQVRRRIRQ